jgi:hypothetical protein
MDGAPADILPERTRVAAGPNAGRLRRLLVWAASDLVLRVLVTTWGMGMSQDSRDRLRSLYRRLREDDVVVEFDPSFPSTPGLALDGGFALRPRTKADGKLLIRVNEHTRLTR